MPSKRNPPKPPAAPRKARNANTKSAPSAPEPDPTPAPSKAPPRSADADSARWRAAEERLGLRLAVLEDGVRRSNADLGRRLAELEKRTAVASP